jgi:hypothetical protein
VRDAVDVATGVLGVLVVGLLRVTWRLSNRVSRLEGRLNGRR